MNKINNEPLINKGCEIIGVNSGDNNQPIIIVGSARGGTSLVAGVLHHLGLFMGDHFDDSVFEDVYLSSAFEKADDKKVKSIIKEYKKKNKIFGWKRPSSVSDLDRVHKIFNEPKYIFIFKDVLSISLRNKISMMMDINDSMRLALKNYMNVINFIDKYSPNALLLSYDKVIKYKDNFVETLDDFCGINASSEKFKKAKKFINPEPAKYLDASRITKSVGHLDGITRDGKYLFGWARYPNASHITAEIEFYLDDELIGTTSANEPRKDVDELYEKPCSFHWEIPQNLKLNETNKIRAKVAADIRELKGSPFYAKNSN